MQEKMKIQHIPVKVYRSEDRLMVTAPMPGLQPEDIMIAIDENSHLTLQGELRGLLKDVKELLTDEWSVGGYYRDLALPNAVDGEHSNVTYGNGVLVIAMPITTNEQTIPATLTLDKIGSMRGEYIGNSGHTHS